jgi:chromosome segregation ATPase
LNDGIAFYFFMSKFLEIQYMQPPSITKCIKKIKNLEKYNVKYKHDNWNMKCENQNLTNINQDHKDEIFFLKRFIQDLGEKSDITHQDNVQYVNKLNDNIKKINAESDKYHRENQTLLRKNKELNNKNKKLDKKSKYLICENKYLIKENNYLIKENKEINKNKEKTEKNNEKTEKNNEKNEKTEKNNEKNEKTEINNEKNEKTEMNNKKTEKNNEKNNEIQKNIQNELKTKENFKNTIKNIFKKVYVIQKDNALIKEDYSILSNDYNDLNNKYKKINNKYNEIVAEYREYQRDLEQNLEESQPLLGPSKMIQFDKLKKYSCANFLTAKKIENKISNKDNILFINKPMSNFNNTGGLPTIWSELQDFFVPQPTKNHTCRSHTSNNFPQHPYKKSHVDEVKRINHDIAVENSKLHHTISELNMTLSKRESECDNLRYKLQNIKSDLSSLKKDMSTNTSTKQDIVCAMLNKSQNSNSGKILENEYAALNKNYKKLQLRYSNIKKECDEYAKKINYSVDSHQEKTKQLAEQIEQIQYEKKILNEEIKNMQKLYSTCNVQSNNRIGSYQTMISNMQKELDETRNYKNKYGELVKATDIEREKHTMKVNNLISNSWKNSDVRAQLDMTNLKKTLEVKELEMDSLKEQNDILQSEQRTCNEFSELQLDLVETEKENSDLRNEIIELTDKLSVCVIDKNDLNDELIETSRDFDIFIGKYDKLLDECEALSLDQSKYQTENQKLVTDFEEANKLVAKLTLDYDQLEKANVIMTTQLSESEKYNQATLDSYNHLEGDYNSKVSEVNQLLDETAKFNDIYNQMKENLTNQLAKQQESILDLEAETIATKEMNKGLAKLLDDKDADKRKNYVMKGEFVALEADYVTLHNKFEDLDFNHNELVSKHDSLKEDYTESVQKHNETDEKIITLTNELDETKWDNTELATNYKQMYEDYTNLKKDNQEKTSSIIELNSKNAELDYNLKASLEDYEDISEECKNINDGLIIKDMKITKTEEMLAEKERLHEITQQDLVKSDESVKIQQHINSELNTRVKSQQTYTDSVLDAHRVLNNEHTMLKGKYNSTKTLRDTLEEKYNQLINETSDMNQKINELTKHNNVLSDTNMKLTEQCNEMKPVYEKVNEQLKDWDVVQDIDFNEDTTESDDVERIL